MDKYCNYCSEAVGETNPRDHSFSWCPHMRLYVCDSDKCKRQHREAERAAAEAAEYNDDRYR